MLALMIVTDQFVSFSFLWFVLLFSLWMLLLALGSIKMQMNFYIPSVMSGDGQKKEVAFSFDDGPDSENTPAVLDILRDYNVKAAFFAVGNKIEKDASIVKRIHEEGHLLGGHSYSHHFFFDLMPYHRVKQELETTEILLYKITGKKTRWFRPPYGVTNPVLARAIRQMKYIPVGWSLKSKDTMMDNEKKLFERITKNIKPGDLLLFHDTRPVTTRVLPLLIGFLNEHQYRIVSPEQLLNISAYEQV
jgi:peptidoglycan-N-acetylglucosamine deacetylase